ncbi:hypothetical protein F2Q69_00037629 [Brassica cretica]|uniref:Uncharacterized protein n=1 Tax=Brassica cretica TaxID=69181 RepID=A0A8S9SC41_BRACR|nr:hypothetical protein F2Q69_00037629 [Brassica cretica]
MYLGSRKKFVTNKDSSRSLGHGSVPSSSNSNVTDSCLSNGGLPDNYLSNDYSFLPGDIPSMQLPAVELTLDYFLFSLDQVITSAVFHPTHCNTLSYSSLKGSIRLIDLRQSTLCDSHSKFYDINMDSGPLSTFQVHEHLRPKWGVATGPYSNLFRVFGVFPGSTETTTMEARRNLMRR